MTCIVGIVNEGNVYMGGERAASDGNSILSITTPKVETREGWIYGYVGTIGIGQLLSYVPLDAKVDDPFIYIRLYIVEELKKSMEAFTNTPAEHDTTWLIGYKGRLFELSSSDWGVIEVTETAAGSGGSFALGSLFTTMYICNNELPISPEVRVALALQSAIAYSPMCQGPIDILSI